MDWAIALLHHLGEVAVWVAVIAFAIFAILNLPGGCARG